MSLTVVIPTTLERPSLAWAIESVREQIIPTELLVISDVEHTGIGPTMNRAMQLVRTTHVAFLGDDDVIDTAMHHWFTQMDEDSDLFIFSMRYRNGTVIPQTTDPYELTFGSVGASFVAKSNVVRRFPFIHEDIDNHIHEDWTFIEQVRHAGLKIQVVPTVAWLIGVSTPGHSDPFASNRGP